MSTTAAEPNHPASLTEWVERLEPHQRLPVARLLMKAAERSHALQEEGTEKGLGTSEATSKRIPMTAALGSPRPNYNPRAKYRKYLCKLYTELCVTAPGTPERKRAEGRYLLALAWVQRRLEAGL